MSTKQQGESIPSADDVGDNVIISSDTRRAERLPPNQVRTKKWPVLDSRGSPELTPEGWSLEVFGLVERELTFDLAAFHELPRVKVFADMHCVTRWSRLGNLWEGVSTRELIERAGVSPTARFVIAHGFDAEFTTNLPLEEFQSEDAVVADIHDGETISLEHGGPVRLVVPKLYAWKSAKWVKALEFVESDRAGYWEEGGYHMVGDPWTEQRFR